MVVAIQRIAQIVSFFIVASYELRKVRRVIVSNFIARVACQNRPAS